MSRYCDYHAIFHFFIAIHSLPRTSLSYSKKLTHFFKGYPISMSSDIYTLAQHLGSQLLARRWQLVTAESCTGGGVAAAITSVAGSSAWFEFGLVTYADRAKQQLLAVDKQVLADAGAVSEAVVQQMLTGALHLSGAQIGVAVSGIAGPGGGTVEKPVGSVWFAWGTPHDCETALHQFAGDRLAVQARAVTVALQGLLRHLEKNTV